jgi:thioredoxin reductase (NADPH)
MDYWYLYAAFACGFMALYTLRQKKIHRNSASKLAEAVQSGMVEPASLHPVIDPGRCIGSGACASACPEEAIGLIDGKAVLNNPAACIGHGACLAACPFDAIKLVFGTEKRGVDIPHLSQNFETNVPGIYIAGELGGMGLIRKAAEQGRQAVASIRKATKGKADLDLLIVGCGPAGISAALSAKHHKLRYLVIEQESSLGGAVYHYPRQKIAMTAPVDLDIVGKVKFGEVQKEALLEFWQNVVKRTGLRIAFHEPMESVSPHERGFLIKTSKKQYVAESVLLAMGRRGTPRKLDVPGEESPKVAYRLVDAAQYAGQSVLVVGGGDSALEAAISLSEEAGTDVTLSYRGDAFSRVKEKNRLRLQEAQRAKRVAVYMGSTVRSIHQDRVEIVDSDGVHVVKNNAVIVCTGGVLPTPLLQKMGITFETKFGQA